MTTLCHHLAQRILQSLLQTVGPVMLDQEVPSETHRMSIWVPGPSEAKAPPQRKARKRSPSAPAEGTPSPPGASTQRAAPTGGFAEQALQVLLESAGPVTVGEEIVSEAQTVAVWFPGQDSRPDRLRRLGLLGLLAKGPVVFEPFSRVPKTRDVYRCLTKLYGWHAVLRRRARRARSKAPFPWLWMLSPKQPSIIVREFELSPVQEWSEGVYRSAPGAGIGLVALNKLPAVRETLALRLLGRGQTQCQAMAELRALKPGAWDRKLLTGVLARLRFDSENGLGETRPDGTRPKEDEKFLANLQQTFGQQELVVAEERTAKTRGTQGPKRSKT